MQWTEYIFNVEPVKPGAEILIAELAELGFESFTETAAGVKAYSTEPIEAAAIEALQLFSNPEFKVSYESGMVEEENWNATWESNFSPIVIGDKVCVRASFHEKPAEVEFEILIDPKMSFGTGHHETTSLMLEALVAMDVADKTLLDMGSGTGVLAILAEMRGASSILAIDNDEWAYENALENVKSNNCNAITVRLGDAALLEDDAFDVILANINLNVLLQDIAAYHSVLNAGGVLLMSGFYESDVDALRDKAEHTGLEFVTHKTKNNWAMATFAKP